MKSDEAPPWGILAAGLKYQDAATLIYHQFWLSKKLCFAAFPSTPFTSDWLGNWVFAAKEKDLPIVLECVHSTLSDPTTKIGAYLAINIPDPAKRRTIIESAKVRPLTIKRNETETIHWSFTAKSPHEDDTIRHRQWIIEARNTEWYHSTLSTGELCIPPHSCKCCKGQDHTTNQCPLNQLAFWPTLFPPKPANTSNPDPLSTDPESILSHNPLDSANNYGRNQSERSHQGNRRPTSRRGARPGHRGNRF